MRDTILCQEPFLTKLSLLLVVAILGGVESAYAQDNGIKLSAGAGVSYLGNFVNQYSTYQGNIQQITDNSTSFGLNGFVDVTPYFTLNFGLRFAVGQLNETGTFAGQDLPNEPYSANISISQFEIGGEAKYPLRVNSIFSWAPKIGLDYVAYWGGSGYGAVNLDSSDMEKEYSPLYLTLGTDLDFNITEHWFIRVPLDIGFGLNAELSSTYYAPNSYSNSSSIGLRAGLEVGYTL